MAPRPRLVLVVFPPAMIALDHVAPLFLLLRTLLVLWLLGSLDEDGPEDVELADGLFDPYKSILSCLFAPRSAHTNSPFRKRPLQDSNLRPAL